MKTIETELRCIRNELRKLQDYSRLTPVAVSIGAAAGLAGLGLSKFKELLRSGEISSFTVDRRRLVRVRELEEWAERSDKRLRPMQRTCGKSVEEEILSKLRR